jgi:hypothetical protein
MISTTTWKVLYFITYVLVNEATFSQNGDWFIIVKRKSWSLCKYK